MNKIICRGYRFPPEIIQRAIWLYYRFTLSLRDVEELLAERSIEVTYETIRQWGIRFGPAIGERKMQGFKSAGSAQRFLSIHASVYNNFNTGRHLISAANHQQLRSESFAAWRQASDAAA